MRTQSVCVYVQNILRMCILRSMYIYALVSYNAYNILDFEVYFVYMYISMCVYVYTSVLY